MSVSSNIKENINEYSTHEGRITCRIYVLRVVGRWIASWVAVICAYVLITLIYVAANIISHNNNYEGMLLMVIALPIMFFVGFVFFYFKMVQEMKRLHDMNLSGWGVIFGFIPLVNIIYYLFLIFNDGTVGPNMYGEDPKGRKRNE